jgi:hypothetical protein
LDRNRHGERRWPGFLRVARLSKSEGISMPPAAPSANYQVLDQAITNKKAVSAKYKGGGERKLLPHVLGTSPSSGQGPDEEIVLCYQFDGFSPMPLVMPHPSPKNWRSFKVSELSDITILNIQIPSAQGGSGWTPKNYAKVGRQNNVTSVKKKR